MTIQLDYSGTGLRNPAQLRLANLALSDEERNAYLSSLAGYQSWMATKYPVIQEQLHYLLRPDSSIDELREARRLLEESGYVPEPVNPINDPLTQITNEFRTTPGGGSGGIRPTPESDFLLQANSRIANLKKNATRSEALNALGIAAGTALGGALLFGGPVAGAGSAAGVTGAAPAGVGLPGMAGTGVGVSSGTAIGGTAAGAIGLPGMAGTGLTIGGAGPLAAIGAGASSGGGLMGLETLPFLSPTATTGLGTMGELGLLGGGVGAAAIPGIEEIVIHGQAPGLFGGATLPATGAAVGIAEPTMEGFLSGELGNSGISPDLSGYGNAAWGGGTAPFTNPSLWETLTNIAGNIPPGTGTAVNLLAGALGGAVNQNGGGDSTGTPVTSIPMPNWGRPNYPAPTMNIQRPQSWSPNLSYNEQAGLLAGGISPPRNYIPLPYLMSILQPPPAPIYDEAIRIMG